MTEPVNRTTSAQPMQEQQRTQQTEQKPKETPSIGKLLVNRAGAVVMTPVAGVAGVITIMGGAINGAVNPNKTFEQGMQEGIQSAGQGADMLDKMWQGKYF